MEKLICLVWAKADADRAAFNRRMLDELPARLIATGATNLRVNIEDDAVAVGAHLRQSRGERQHDATVQFWLPCANQLFRQAVDTVLDDVSERWAGWVVAESTVIANFAHPPVLGQRTSGWAQMAYLVRPDRLSHAEWLAAWQDRHTAVAIATQANFEYVQNLLVRPITSETPPYAAIVEECFPEAAMNDPLAFFDAAGDGGKFKANLDRMMASCDAFIDRGAIDVIPTSQYNFGTSADYAGA